MAPSKWGRKRKPSGRAEGHLFETGASRLDSCITMCASMVSELDDRAGMAARPCDGAAAPEPHLQRLTHLHHFATPEKYIS